MARSNYERARYNSIIVFVSDNPTLLSGSVEYRNSLGDS